MPKTGASYPHQLWRYINGKPYKGYHESETKEGNKALAKHLRSLGIPARAVTLPESRTWHGHLERYIIYAPRDLEAKHNINFRIAAWEREQKGLPVEYCPKCGQPLNFNFELDVPIVKCTAPEWCGYLMGLDNKS